MKKQLISEALNEISDQHIAEAADVKKRKRLPFLGAVAAILALVLIFKFVDIPMAIAAEAVGIPTDSRVTVRPDYDDYDNREGWLKELEAWEAERDLRSSTVKESLEQMNHFLQASCTEFLSGSQENLLYSPINAYIGLAAAAELTAGNTRQQILNTIGAEDLTALRRQVSAIWETVYRDDGNEICTLANSLWLDKALTYRQEPMDILAHDYYTAVYRQDLSSNRALKDIQAWLSNNTGGLLKDSAQQVQLPDQAVLALYSTIYFQSKWQEEFSASRNTQKVFHGSSGDSTATFMNGSLWQMNYYWGEDYGAIRLGLKNGTEMWFILPDPGKTPADVLKNGEYLQMIAAPYEGWENTKYMKVNLSVPKFDIQSRQDLRDGLMKIGITDLFNFNSADFSAAFDAPACITAVNQAVRVQIDEKGVKAAAYIELPGAGAAMPPEEVIDFVLDRPFLFVIADSGIPLFAGTVNNVS